MPRKDVARKRVEIFMRADLAQFIEQWAERLVSSRSQVVEMLIVDKVRDVEGVLVGIGFPEELPGYPDDADVAAAAQEYNRRLFEESE